MAKPRKEIIVGREYGWLTVLGSAEKDKTGHLRWNVKCRCGKKFSVPTGRLSKENCKCGDCAEPPGRKRLSFPGDIINGFEILSEAGNNRYGVILFKCRCLKCGSVSTHTRGELTARKGKRCQCCPPEYHFRIEGDAAYGELPDGTEFIVDSNMIPIISKGNWHLKKDKGYIISRNAEGETIQLHRFVLGLPDKSVIVDHINRNKLDCRRNNLRIVTPQQNSMNKSLQKNSTTGYAGVVYLKDKQRYRSVIGLNDRRIYLLTSKSAEECAQAYNYAAALIFGEYQGHMNDVSEASDKLKKIINKRCEPYRFESMLATQPCGFFNGMIKEAL